MRKIVIADIHGCANTLKTLLSEKVRISTTDELYFLGDYINKGPNSKEVIDHILELRNQGFNITCLRGNHEQYLIDGLKFSWEEVAFKTRGGAATLRSFGVDKVKDIPEYYVDFIESLIYYIELENYLLVHAGLNFDLADPFRDDFAMLNVKRMEVNPAKIGGKRILHGHVPTALREIKRDIASGTALHYSLDAGCVYDHHPGMSHLLAFDIISNTIYEQKNLDGFSN